MSLYAMKNRSILKFGLTACMIFLSLLTFSQVEVPEGDPDNGKTLFRNNCAQCHNKNMTDDLTGPALGGTLERWSDYPMEDLYSWIRNSQKMISEGHPKAEELWDEWGPTLMNNFTQLTDQEINDILVYVHGVHTGTYGAAEDATAATDGAAAGEERDNTFLFILLILILAFLSFILARTISVLNSLARAEETGAATPRKTIWDVLSSKTVVSIVIFALIVMGGYTTVHNAIDLGRQQGYTPEQPIKFYHDVHAGEHQIDCQYCHDGARRSKQAVIPSANTCMNCHRAIKSGTRFGAQELTKIYASIGFDPMNDTYIDGYDTLTNEEISNIYKKWLAEDYAKGEDAEASSERIQLVADEQWEEIESSLTNEQKKTVAGPIEWTRVHNLPDHVYFNHAQHVNSGEVDCQQCHGKVEEMEILSQYAPLSMGWCINCHRESEVKGFSDNPYYHEEYREYHEELKSGERQKVTVKEIGGLECQKCHY